MDELKHIVRYRSYDNTILFPIKIASAILPHFASAVNQWSNKRPYDLLTFDFSAVQKPYSNGMLGVIATINKLTLQRDFRYKIVLPNDQNVRKLFSITNWSYYLDSRNFSKSESVHDRHLVTRQFTSFEDLPLIVNDFMDVVLRNMRTPKDILSGLEWSINELCDNVINHSESPVGGFIEVVTYTKENKIAFSIADSGRGILSSLKEGIPTLHTDEQAIGEAIKAGVTRNKKFGQGNGLAGSLRITTMSGGSLDISSGKGRFYSTSGNSTSKEFDKSQPYDGTIVSGTILIAKNFSIVKALEFGGKISYTPINIIDLNYEMKDQDCLLMRMRDETTGYGTRKAGKQMNMKILNFISSKPNYPIYVDWEGVPVISSSFADEFMGKLFVELGPLNFSGLIRNKNMEQLVKGLLDKAIAQRLTQESR